MPERSRNSRDMNTFTPDWWWHEAHSLHDQAHHLAHRPLDLCVPLWTRPPGDERQRLLHDALSYGERHPGVFPDDLLSGLRGALARNTRNTRSMKGEVDAG